MQTTWTTWVPNPQYDEVYARVRALTVFVELAGAFDGDALLRGAEPFDLGGAEVELAQLRRKLATLPQGSWVPVHGSSTNWTTSAVTGTSTAFLPWKLAL